eukprot:TRINITY_DN3399_c0_g1_i1.p1 TRINITY_DN3399_c0_g1~~TRINITY_DN3399_c0_g1_i1.p1  ORF type:complete len:406 (-),score=93.24 TRINITY_DN3399_c0_g1_i1:41-1258(-)
MVNKLTFETINSKIGKPGDPATLEEVTVSNKQIDEVGSFAKFAKLKKLDLSNNRMRFKRNIEGLFQAPALEELDLRGNPVCNEAGYRAYMIEGIKTLKVLDGVPVGYERDQKPVQNTPKKSPLFDDGEDDSDNLFANNPLSKNAKPQTTVKVDEPKEIPAKTSPVKEDKNSQVDVPANEVSPPLPKEEKPSPVQKAPEVVEKPKEVPTPKIEAQPVKKIEEKPKPAQPAPVTEKKPAQIEKPKEDPKPKPAQKPEEKPKQEQTNTSTADNKTTTSQSTPGVFKDSRSRLEISTKLHESIQAPEPQVIEVEQPKKEMLTEDSLFGSKKSVFQNDVTIDRSLFEITEVPQKKPVVQKEQPAAKVTVTIADDDDDLFGTKSTSTNKKASGGDDLFDLVSTNKKRRSRS